jgi:cytochrome c peroxidase
MKAKRIMLSTIPGLLFICLFVVSCNKPVIGPKPEDPQGDPVLPMVPYDYQSKHNINDHYATLGRVLFYDRKLSVNDAVACGSCHQQQFAFANNTKFDRGFDGQFLNRNSPSIQGFRGFDNRINTFQFPNNENNSPNANNQKKVLLFWDGRQTSLADMVLNPVLNHKEMNMPDFASLTAKLSELPYYKTLFANAYGDESITKERIALALEAFVCCLNTKTVNAFSTSGATVEPIPILSQITTQEEMGRFLFHVKYNCAECHDPSSKTNITNPGNPGEPPGNPEPYGNPVPTGDDLSFAFFNIGLDQVSIDRGLGNITSRPGDVGLFRVPTLQNIAFTAPYMHDGRFTTLSQVLDHYSHEIKPNQNLSPKFKNFDGSPKKLNILPAEKEAIIAFLKTLKNDDFLTNPMYSDPFKK